MMTVMEFQREKFDISTQIISDLLFKSLFQISCLSVSIFILCPGAQLDLSQDGCQVLESRMEGGFLGSHPSTILQHVPHLLGFKRLMHQNDVKYLSKGFKSIFFMKYEVFQTLEVVLGRMRAPVAKF